MQRIDWRRATVALLQTLAMVLIITRAAERRRQRAAKGIPPQRDYSKCPVMKGLKRYCGDGPCSGECQPKKVLDKVSAQ
jgi:hypothetical protein